MLIELGHFSKIFNQIHEISNCIHTETDDKHFINTLTHFKIDSQFFKPFKIHFNNIFHTIEQNLRAKTFRQSDTSDTFEHRRKAFSNVLIGLDCVKISSFHPEKIVIT